jgi:hypothetical protein
LLLKYKGELLRKSKSPFGCDLTTFVVTNLTLSNLPPQLLVLLFALAAIVAFCFYAKAKAASQAKARGKHKGIALPGEGYNSVCVTLVGEVKRLTDLTF